MEAERPRSHGDGRDIPIAIIGLAFEFPQGATSVESFWQMISEGRSASTEFPSDRLNIDAFYHPDENRPSSIPLRGGHFVTEDLGAFDAPFFSITPDEAACMDPQHRRILETTYHALEDSGIPISKCSGSNTSVYTGCFTNDYLSILQQDYDAEQRHAAMGIAPSMLANRLSWFFNFKGTSMNLDSACSSSLIALHLACQDLHAGGSEMAIVGGANLVYHPNFMKIMSDFNFLSRDSRCWSFDQKANGYSRGEGSAVIVIKRLDRALQDGDTIRAVIRNTGSNQDGRTPGITQPSQEAQIDLIRQTYRQGNIDMEPTRFFEAHATGTPVGDPVEGNAIGEAFREYRSERDPLYIGAIKANIGHLEGCSGLAGIIKATLVLERGIIPPIAGFESLNSRIDAKSLNLHFPTESVPWPSAIVRRACVNSFGFGGTNAVAILDDAYHYLKLNGMSGFHRTRLPSLVNGHGGRPNDQSSNQINLENGVHNGVGSSVTNGINGSVTTGINGSVANGVNGSATYSVNGSVTNGVNGSVSNGINGSVPNSINGYVTSGINGSVNRHGLKAENHSQNESAYADSDGANGRMRNGTTDPAYEASLARLLIWSASDQDGAQKLSDAYKHYIHNQTPKIDDLAYTLAVRRSHFKWRSFTVVDSNNGTPLVGTTTSAPVKATASDGGIAFVFTGQGAQYLGMGRQLVAFPIFRDNLAKSDDCLRRLGCQWSLLNIIAGRVDVDIDRPEYSQPLTTCLQLALVDLLRSFDIVPSVVMGHSSGEVAAAYAAGVLSQSSATKIAYYRGQLSSQLASQVEGLTMMAVGLSKENVIPYLDRLRKADGVLNVAVGCVNSPKSVTLTGEANQLSRLELWLKEDSIFARKLHVRIAYHSRFMDPIANDYSKAIEGLEIEQSSGFVSMISSVTGDIVTAATLASADYWVRNLTSAVEFEAAFGRLLTRANTKPRKQLGKTVVANPFAVSHVLEIGPHGALQGPIRESLQAFDGAKKPGYIASLNRNQDACLALLNAVGSLYSVGYPVNLLRANGLDDSPRPAPADMPKYPFNHSQSHWREGHLSRNFRFREKARHDLLGTRCLDWNPLMAQWRNVMRLDELPWLEDHTIGGEIVFPAAGMTVMAIEGLRELFGNLASLRGIVIQNATFSHAISFPRGVDKIETQLTLSRQSQSSDLSTWSQFRLFVLENGSYIECCSGLIRAVVDEQDQDSITSSGPWTGGTLEDWIARVNQACHSPEKDPYDVPAEIEVRYGPVFQNLEHMRLGAQGEAVAQVNTETCELKTSGPLAPSFAVHPATLDGLAQPLLQALLAQEREVLPTMVPVRLASLWVDCSSNALHEGKLNVTARCSFRGYRGGSADVVATAIDSSKPLIFLEGLETTFISSTELEKPQRTVDHRLLCTKLVWKPDIDTMTHEQVLLHCIRGRPKLPADAVESYQSLMVAILCFVLDTIAFMDENPGIRLSRHLQAYIGWMRYQQERLRNGESLVTQQSVQQVLDDSEAREHIVSQIENSAVDGFFFMQIGRNVTKMLRGEIDPLAFMFHDGLADRYYEKMLANDHHAYPASQYIELLSFKNPSMNILEVGAGTGGQTMRLLEAMSSDGVKKWARYDYTDISPGFFSQARTKFHKYLDRMNFAVCDISKYPISESFEAGTYDLVVASHVLHATDNLRQSLRNIRKLLKPNGKLLLFETTRTEAIQVSFAFGLLKGWWDPLEYEQRSLHSPCLTVAQWDEWLREAGFSGVDVEIPGQEIPLCRDSSIIVSSAASSVASAIAKAIPQVNIVVDGEVEAQRALAKLLESQLPESLGTSCETFTLEKLAQANIPVPSVTIFLREIDAVFLDGISEVDYQNLQSILVKAKDVIWATRAGSLDRMEPRHHLALGLGRTLMSEDSYRKFLLLSLDGYDRGAEQVANVICELSQRVIELPVEGMEDCYVAGDGTLQICRVSENVDMDTKVAQAILPRQTIECKLTADTPVTLRLGAPGHLDTLEWKESDDEGLRGAESMNPDEVVVQVCAIGLTFRDHLVASGQLDESELGTECAGVVQAAGDNSGLQVGDRVCLLATSTCRSVLRTAASGVAAIPPHMSFAEAASLPTALWLSYRALVDVARVEKGETVLIHRASSCMGQIAIQLAKQLGARVLVTAPSGASSELLQKRFMVPETDIFDTEDGSAVSKIYSRTDRAGVDVVIGPLAKDGHRITFDFSACLAPFGRLVDISLLRASDSTPSQLQFGNRASVNISRASINMVDLLQRKPSLAHATFQRAAKMAFEPSFRTPQPLHAFGASEVEAAFRNFNAPDVIGKSVIEMNPDMSVTVNMRSRPRYNFRSDATYVIAGGLGGLGRSFARWMVSRGARNLILLSRSGAKVAAAKALVVELTSQGVCVATPPVDISNLSSLKQEMEKLEEHMPPIRGCIQATVALRDNLFPNMTYEDWVIGTSSKATGSWNLHAALPSGLDFFVLLASLNGIVGGRAQANYAAGNTFKDALAHHRISLGEKAVSIDLGLMVAEGVIAENEILLANMRRLGHLMDISQEELIALLDYYCDPALPLLTHDQAQILVGLETPAAVLAKGIDLHHSIHRPIFRQLFRMSSSAESAESAESLEQKLERNRAGVLRRAATDEEASELVTGWFVAKLAQVLGLDVGDVDPDKPVPAYGIDSLVAIDLKNWFAREISAEVQVFLLLGNTPIRQVATEAAARSAHRISAA